MFSFVINACLFVLLICLLLQTSPHALPTYAQVKSHGTSHLCSIKKKKKQVNVKKCFAFQFGKSIHRLTICKT